VLRVLLVDDHAGLRRAIRDLLKARGFEVVGEADSARSALAVAVRLAPDAVLLDVRLGAADGYSVCRALSVALPHVAVVLTSSDDACHAPRLARLVGARGFVPKARLHEADLHAMFTHSV
jgi:DNA-binding NarL/FixJ family response regulator